MLYKKVVKQIRELKWDSLNSKDIQRLMVLSGYSALEFAESLRLALELNPDNQSLQEMAKEELKADNLSFGDYNKHGDHGEFLWHFIKKYGLDSRNPDLQNVGETYMQRVRALGPEVRVMSIVSRETELPGIFTKILTANNWRAKGLPEFRYYLERHVALDSAEGGHADMLRSMKVDDRVVDFYRARLDMYRILPKLFT